MAEPALTPDEARSLLRECVTVVRPGETLVVRAYDWMTPQQMREVQNVFNAMHDDGFVPFRAWIVPGAELGVVETAPEGPFEPIQPVPVDVDPDAPRPQPRRFQYRFASLPPEVTHRCPAKGEGLMPCCGLTPYEVPATDRLARDPGLVTCTGEKRDHL
jgi:hypothetical protein